MHLHFENASTDWFHGAESFFKRQYFLSWCTNVSYIPHSMWRNIKNKNTF